MRFLGFPLRIGIAFGLLASVLALGGCLVPVFPMPAGMSGIPGLPGIQPKVPITINSTAAEPLKEGTFFYLVGKPGQFADSDLYFGEVERFVTTALSTRGLSQAPRANRTDITVEIQYAMTAPPRTGGARPTPNPEFEKHLTLIARAPVKITDPPGSTPKVVWTIHLSATNESDDLRLYLAMFAAAAIDEIGVDSYGDKTVWMSETDLGIEYVRTGTVKKR